jgi:hypothetical protein
MSYAPANCLRACSRLAAKVTPDTQKGASLCDLCEIKRTAPSHLISANIVNIRAVTARDRLPFKEYQCPLRLCVRERRTGKTFGSESYSNANGQIILRLEALPPAHH